MATKAKTKSKTKRSFPKAKIVIQNSRNNSVTIHLKTCHIYWRGAKLSLSGTKGSSPCQLTIDQDDSRDLA